MFHLLFRLNIMQKRLEIMSIYVFNVSPQPESLRDCPFQSISLSLEKINQYKVNSKSEIDLSVQSFVKLNVLSI